MTPAERDLARDRLACATRGTIGDYIDAAVAIVREHGEEATEVLSVADYAWASTVLQAAILATLNAAALAEVARVESGVGRVVSMDPPDGFSPDVVLTTDSGWCFRIFVDGVWPQDWDYVDDVKPPGGEWVDIWDFPRGGGQASFRYGIFESLAYFFPEDRTKWEPKP